MSNSGVDSAWDVLGRLDPQRVAAEAAVGYSPEKGCYLLESFGMGFDVCPEERRIKGLDDRACDVAQRYSYFFEISALMYLSGSKDVGLTGRHVRPNDLKGGHHFFSGTHELPLGRLASVYGADRDAFIEKAASLSGRPLRFGDASVELLPFPRVPVTLILWLGDDEFPPRADLLFDSSVELHLPLDIAWSVAMLCVLVMM